MEGVHVLVASLASLGASLGASSASLVACLGASLGASLVASLVASWASLGASWAYLGASWAYLGASSASLAQDLLASCEAEWAHLVWGRLDLLVRKAQLAFRARQREQALVLLAQPYLTGLEEEGLR